MAGKKKINTRLGFNELKRIAPHQRAYLINQNCEQRDERGKIQYLSPEEHSPAWLYVKDVIEALEFRRPKGYLGMVKYLNRVLRYSV